MLDKNMSLETERLRLRPFTYGDSTEIYEIMREKAMYTYSVDEPWKSTGDAEEFIECALWLYDMSHVTFRHFLAVTMKDTGKIIGICGVGGISYDHSQNELFYHIGKDYWGNGYATEVGRAILEYSFSDLHLDEIIGAVHPGNIASNRAMEKLGFQRTGILENLPLEHSGYNGHYLYKLKKTDYIR